MKRQSNYLLLFCLLIFSTACKSQSNYRHQIGVDPGMLIQLFSINENVQGINYKYNFHKKCFITLGGHASFSNNQLRTISNELRLGLQRVFVATQQASIFYGADFVRYKSLYNNREEYILKKRLDLVLGLKFNTFKNLAISLDYRAPFEWSSYSDTSNTDELQVSFGESINFMVIFQF